MANNDSRRECRQQEAEEPSRDEYHKHSPSPLRQADRPDAVPLNSMRNASHDTSTARTDSCSTNRLVEEAHAECRNETRVRLHLSVGMFPCWPTLLNLFQCAPADD